MKYKIYLPIVLLISIFTMIGCSQDDIKKSDYDYVPKTGVTLASVTLQAADSIGEDMLKCKAEITKAGESKILDKGFLVSETEDFQSYTAYSIAKDTLVLEQKLKVVQGKNVYIKAYVQCLDGMSYSQKVIQKNLPITWIDMGIVEYKDMDFDDYDVAKVSIQQNAFNKKLFRLKNLYHTFNPKLPKVHLLFFLDDNYNASTLPTGTQDFGTGYPIYYDDVKLSQYCSFTNKGNVYSIKYTLVENGQPAFLGKSEFTWIKGYPNK